MSVQIQIAQEEFSTNSLQEKHISRETASKLNPLIGSVMHRDTMNNIADLLQMTQDLMLGDGSCGDGINITESGKEGIYQFSEVIQSALRYEAEIPKE